MLDLFNNLTKRKINYYTTNRPNRKHMSQDLQPQSNQLECGTILSKTSNLTAMVGLQTKISGTHTDKHAPPNNKW